jgi:predicted nucleotidyltransferase
VTSNQLSCLQPIGPRFQRRLERSGAPVESSLERAPALGYCSRMVDRKDISRFAREVAREFSPERIVLFGSYATGKATEDSDVDILVILAHAQRNIEKSLDITRKVNRSFPLDLIVRTPQETRRRLKQHDMFLTSILNEGKTLYARRGQGMGGKSRG